MRRVAITGLGAICALGRTAAEFADSVRQGRPGIGPIQSCDMSPFRFQNGAEVHGYTHQPYFDDRRADFIDRFAQFAVIAAREAVENAAIEWTPALRESAAIVTGSCVGGQSTEDIGFHEVYKLGHNRVHPLTIPKTMANAGASHISMEFGITGPSFTISTACSSAGHAIGQAYWMVRSGVTDLALTGGSEAPFSFGILKAWESMRVVSPDTCRPFSRDRRGMILGEGSAMFVLEEYERAKARGAHIYAEIAGYATRSNAFHMTGLRPDGLEMAEAIRTALDEAQVNPDQIDYVNAHGSGTKQNDRHETAAVKRILGDHAYRTPMSSIKSMVGHSLGAIGSIEIAASALAIENNLVPPTANLHEADPECDLDYVPLVAREKPLSAVLTVGSGFGGFQSAMVLTRGVTP